MYLTSVTLGYEGLERAQVQEKKGETSLEAATALVESNRDAVGLWLDKQVSKDCSLFPDVLKELSDTAIYSLERPSRILPFSVISQRIGKTRSSNRWPPYTSSDLLL